MRAVGCYLIACAVAALAPTLWPMLSSAPESSGVDRFPGWPEELDGMLLTPLPLGEVERRFESGFPGRIGRFTSGGRDVVLRWVEVETRKLHPVADCLRAEGYEVVPTVAAAGRPGWTCSDARRDGVAIRACEQIRSVDGATWADISSWYWAGFRGTSDGPWWAVTVATGLGGP